MRSRAAAIDTTLAVLAAALVLVVSPGIAVTGMVAAAVLVVCGISFLWTARRRR